MKIQGTLCFTAFLFLVSPIQSRQTQSAAPGEIESAHRTSQERRNVEQKLQTKLDDLDREIKDLKDKAAREGKNASKEINQQLEELDQKHGVARRRLKQLKGSSQDAWEETKKGLDSVMDDLQETYKRATSHF